MKCTKRQKGLIPAPSYFTDHRYAPYALAIGQVALSWNDLHEILGHLFWIVMGGGWRDLPVGVWAAVDNDRIKRKMLKAAVNAATPTDLIHFPKMTSDIEWILKEATTLEDARNDIVHSPLVLLTYGETPAETVTGKGKKHFVIPDTVHMNTRAKKLADKIAEHQVGKKRLLEEFRLCRDSITVLRDFAFEICWAMGGRRVGIVPWPDRPSLPNRGQKKSQP